MAGLRARHVELTLQVGKGDIEIDHGHFWRSMALLASLKEREEVVEIGIRCLAFIESGLQRCGHLPQAVQLSGARFGLGSAEIYRDTDRPSITQAGSAVGLQ